MTSSNGHVWSRRLRHGWSSMLFVSLLGGCVVDAMMQGAAPTSGGSTGMEVVSPTVTTAGATEAPRTQAPSTTQACTPYAGERCYWMENTSGRFCWVPATSAPTIQHCFAFDSCDGGGGQSNGGCYKWSNGSDGPRQPWPR